MTTQPARSRRQVLEAALAKDPTDAFARYGLALECTKAGDHDAAIGHFRALIEAHPEYVPGYQQLAMLLVRLARTGDAKNIFQAGIAAARKAGNAHAATEMETMLAELA